MRNNQLFFTTYNKYNWILLKQKSNRWICLRDHDHKGSISICLHSTRGQESGSHNMMHALCKYGQKLKKVFNSQSLQKHRLMTICFTVQLWALLSIGSVLTEYLLWALQNRWAHFSGLLASALFGMKEIKRQTGKNWTGKRQTRLQNTSWNTHSCC